jgi:hypothetical protein
MRRTESVTGDKIAVGDVLFVQGYRFRVVSPPVREIANTPACERYSIKLQACEGSSLIGTAYETMTAGLRVNLPWTREVSP